MGPGRRDHAAGKAIRLVARRLTVQGVFRVDQRRDALRPNFCHGGLQFLIGHGGRVLLQRTRRLKLPAVAARAFVLSVPKINA
jgi:hypothetical protein